MCFSWLLIHAKCCFDAKGVFLNGAHFNISCSIGIFTGERPGILLPHRGLTPDLAQCGEPLTQMWPVHFFTLGFWHDLAHIIYNSSRLFLLQL